MQRAGGGGTEVAPPLPEEYCKTVRQVRDTRKKPLEKVRATEDRKGDTGDLPGYVPMGEYQRLQEVYVYWVHFNYVVQLSGIIGDNDN